MRKDYQKKAKDKIKKVLVKEVFQQATLVDFNKKIKFKRTVVQPNLYHRFFNSSINNYIDVIFIVAEVEEIESTLRS